MEKKGRLVLLLSIVILIVIPLSYAASPGIDFSSVGQTLGKFTRGIYDLIGNFYTVYVICMGFLAYILHKFCLQGLSTLPWFKGSNHVNRVAWCISLMAVLGLSYLNRGMNINVPIRRIFANNVMIPILAVALFFFAIRHAMGET